MANTAVKERDYRRAIRSIAEDGESSDSEDGFDIVSASRKRLNISQHIDSLTQATAESQETRISGQKPLAKPNVVTASHSRLKEHASKNLPTDSETLSSSEWSSDDAHAVYRTWQNRKTLKRKRVAAETNRLRAQKKSKAASTARSSIVGRKPSRRQLQDVPIEPGTNSLSYGVAAEETFLDEPVPEYVVKRREDLRMAKESGLRYPPRYLGFGIEREVEEKPQLYNAIKPQRASMDIELKKSSGVIPAPIAKWLRDYQIEGVQFLHDSFVKQNGAILGDDMGLGKTIQVIAFLTAAFGKSGTKGDAKAMRDFRRHGHGYWYPKVLIVCPGTLMQNWEDELDKWGWWEVYRYHGGSAADRKGVLSAAAKGMLEIMITTYTTYRNHESEINTVDWDCIIADECHQIKSKDAEITKAMNKINALCRIGLTGTAIQNKYEELWNLLNWARPGAYGSAQEWTQTISLPLKMGQAHDATNAQLADARSRAKELVQKVLPSVFLRRMKTLIAHQLPKKSDRVVFCQLTDTQADAYRSFLDSERCSLIRDSTQPCECRSGLRQGQCCFNDEKAGWTKYIFPCMLTLQKLANHLALIVPVSTDHHDKQAKDLENLETACPDTYKDLFEIRDNILNQSQREFCGKWKVLRRLLDFWHANGDKVLIFSHSVRLLRLLRGLFTVDGTKYDYTYLDGSMKYAERSAAVSEFNANPSRFVFLISTKAGGVGLNITSANKVVIIDPHWNPAYDLQAQDRAYRIGQTRDVEVFRLISSGTIEEIVYARQIYKQQQANIGYNASEERRYFKGVMDKFEKRGELFGLENLFTFHENSEMLRKVLHKTNVAETRAGVETLDVQFDESQIDENEENELLSDKSLGITADKSNPNLAEIRRLAESFASTTSSGLTSSHKSKYRQRPASDPINAILAKAGVAYTHENSEVIGRSDIEVRLGKQAMELRNDVNAAMKRVFTASQSQSQSQSHAHGHTRYNEDVRQPGTVVNPIALDASASDSESSTYHSRTKYFKPTYRYRPSSPIRRRQFGAIAASLSFDDPVEFALLVEGSTQKERREILGRFYSGRRKAMGRDFAEGEE